MVDQGSCRARMGAPEESRTLGVFEEALQIAPGFIWGLFWGAWETLLYTRLPHGGDRALQGGSGHAAQGAKTEKYRNQ